VSGIFGIYQLDGGPVDPLRLETMRSSMAEWGPDGCDILLNGSIGFGQMRFFSTPEAKLEKMPIADKTSAIFFTAAGRVDNREELLKQLAEGARPSAIQSARRYNQTIISDVEILFRAYLRWGEDCPVRIYGDWSFAAFHARERKLFIARNHYSGTALYYYSDPRVFAFASSRKALLALNLAPVEMDELYLAQILISWPAYHGERTIQSQIKRLPPAHCIAVTPAGATVRQYWRLEDVSETSLPRREDYADAFRDVFDEAVRCRLRTNGAVAVSLSGGLDSGSVAVTAATLLKADGKRLIALTSVPLSDTGQYVGGCFGDEYPFARSTAGFSGNIDLHPVTARTITPISAIRRMLPIINEPGFAAGNFFWTQAVKEAARAGGCRVLLNGAAGNAGISWTGSVLSQSVAFQIRELGWRRLLKELAKRSAPPSFFKKWLTMRMRQDAWARSTAIHPDLARRLKLKERYLNDQSMYPRSAREERCRILQPGRFMGGCTQTETSVVHELETRDPTSDPRVLAFTFSVPDHIFRDPETGLDRWLIRQAMKGRLPEDVRLNRRRGRQAGDLVPRLRACADEVETALAELETGPAAAYVNVPYMRAVWSMVRTDDTPEAFIKSITVLTRGISAGLWVNGFYNAS
jgi:asparagine synthase (glutamine-hydrolysing)